PCTGSGSGAAVSSDVPPSVRIPMTTAAITRSASTRSVTVLRRRAAFGPGDVDAPPAAPPPAAPPPAASPPAPLPVESPPAGLPDPAAAAPEAPEPARPAVPFDDALFDDAAFDDAPLPVASPAPAVGRPPPAASSAGRSSVG